MSHIVTDHEQRKTGFVKNNQRRLNKEGSRPFESINSRLPRRHFSRETISGDAARNEII